MVTISFVVALILMVLFLALGGWGLQWVAPRAYDEDPALGWMARIVSGLLILGTVIGFGYGLYPYRWEYHSYARVTGVAQADAKSRFLGGDGGPSELFLIQLPQGLYRCDDTRCASVKKGHRVALSCIKEWNYGGTDGYVCRYVSSD